MKGEIHGSSPSSDSGGGVDEPEPQQLSQRGKKSKAVRRRWHVPHAKEMTATKASNNNNAAKSSKIRTTPGHHQQQDVELREHSPQQSLPQSVRRKESLALDVSEEDQNQRTGAGDSSNKHNRSEAELFASEVKRYSKETITKGRRNLVKKFNRFFMNNPEFDTNNNNDNDDSLSPMGDGGNWNKDGDEDSSSKRKGRTCSIALFWLQLVMPCVGWLRSYKFKEYFPSDAIAGVSVAMMVVPQSISYAALAGLPSEFGLYTALLPVFIYALFGSSRQLAVGPVAIVSLLMKEGLHKAIPASLDIQDPNNPIGEDQIQAQAQYTLMAVQVTFIVGIIELLMGLVRLGFLTNFLSHSVILGFTHGSAILIGLSQLKHVIGIKAKNSNARVQDFIQAYVDAGDTFDWRVLIMGLSFLAILIAMKELGKRNSNNPLKWFRTVGPLTVSVLGIVICYSVRLDKYGIPLVGKFEAGFPSVTYTELFPMPSDGSEFITTAISCAIVGFLESVSIAKRLAVKNKYHLYANQELRALGLANLAGAGFSAYPATGSFSRSAVSNDTGAKTQLGGCFTAVIVLIVVLFVTKPFYYMPMSALGAIVISGVLGLLDINEALYLFRLNKVDFLVWMASFFGTLFLGAELGLLIAIGLALLFVIYESAFPQIVELGRLEGTTVYRNMKQYPHAKRLSSVMILRVGAPIYFANCSYVREMFEYYLEKRKSSGHVIEVVIMEMSPVSHVDATGVHAMQEMIEDFVGSRGLRFMIANPNPQVMQSLQQDEKIWKVLMPCETLASCPTEALVDSFIVSGSPMLPHIAESLRSTIKDNTTLYYGTCYESNVFVRVHDAVKESVYFLKEKAKNKMEDEQSKVRALNVFEEESQMFFLDLQQQGGDKDKDKDKEETVSRKMSIDEEGPSPSWLGSKLV
jgi:sulfate transporter 4